VKEIGCTQERNHPKTQAFKNSKIQEFKKNQRPRADVCIAAFLHS